MNRTSTNRAVPVKYSTGLHYWSWLLTSASLYEGPHPLPWELLCFLLGECISQSHWLWVWSCDVLWLKHVCNVKGAMSEQKHGNCSFRFSPQQKTQGLSSRLQQIWSQPVIPKDMKKKSLFIVVSSWEWEDHYFIQADWFKFLVQKEIRKKLMTVGKNLHWFWSDFLKILVVKPRERREVETSNIHIQYSLPQTESLKLAMTLRVTLASKMYAKVTSLTVGQKIWRSLCAILHPFLALLCLPWKLYPLQCCAPYTYRMLKCSLLGALSCPHRRSFLESHPAL